MRKITFILAALAALTLLLSSPVSAHPVTFEVSGTVESATLSLGSHRTRCELSDGSFLYGLERVELDIVDLGGIPPDSLPLQTTKVVCSGDLACSCVSAGRPGSEISGNGVLVRGELVLLEIGAR
jgi:hypothetical protein